MDQPLLDARLSDSLSLATVKARKHLLVSSVLGIAIAKMDLVPRKISMLGIEFSDLNKVSFTYIVAAICCYAAIAFSSYAISDFLQWRSTIRQIRIAYGIHASRSGLGSRSNFAHSLAYKLRILVDYFIPLAAAAFSIYSLICLGKEI